MRLGICGFLTDEVLLAQIGVAVGAVFRQSGTAVRFGQRSVGRLHALCGSRRGCGSSGETRIEIDRFHFCQQLPRLDRVALIDHYPRHAPGQSRADAVATSRLDGGNSEQHAFEPGFLGRVKCHLDGRQRPLGGDDPAKGNKESEGNPTEDQRAFVWKTHDLTPR